MKTEEELLFDIITNTIKIDNFISDEIKDSLGLEEDIESIGFDEYEITNAEQMGLFYTIMENIGASTKIKLLKKILGVEFKGLKNFENKLLRLYKIRNKFAHSISITYSKDNVKIKKDLEELHKEHTKLYEEIKEFILKKMQYPKRL